MVYRTTLGILRSMSTMPDLNHHVAQAKAIELLKAQGWLETTPERDFYTFDLPLDPELVKLKGMALVLEPMFILGGITVAARSHSTQYRFIAKDDPTEMLSIASSFTATLLEYAFGKLKFSHIFCITLYRPKCEGLVSPYVRLSMRGVSKARGFVES